ncbi:DUF3159 domain-containing protein [Spirillospora sp. CA-255316]
MDIETTPQGASADRRASGDVAGRGERGFSAQAKGIAFEIAPLFCFTMTFALTHRVAIAVSIALVAGTAVTVYRLVRGRPAWRSLSALAIVAIGALLAMRSGEATDFFLPQLVMHLGIGTVSGVLILVGWPPAGLVVGLLNGEGLRWRRCPRRRRAFTVASLILLASPLVMSVAGLPLYLASNAVALGVVDMFGPLTFTLAALVAWRAYSRSIAAHSCAGGSCTEDPRR